MRKIDTSGPTPIVIKSFRNVEPLITRQEGGNTLFIKAVFTSTQERITKFFIEDATTDKKAFGTMMVTTPDEQRVFATSLIEVNGKKVLVGCLRAEGGGIVWFHGEPSADVN